MHWVKKDPPHRLIFVWIHVDPPHRLTKAKIMPREARLLNNAHF